MEACLSGRQTLLQILLKAGCRVKQANASVVGLFFLPQPHPSLNSKENFNISERRFFFLASFVGVSAGTTLTRSPKLRPCWRRTSAVLGMPSGSSAPRGHGPVALTSSPGAGISPRIASPRPHGGGNGLDGSLKKVANLPARSRRSTLVAQVSPVTQNALPSMIQETSHPELQKATSCRGRLLGCWKTGCVHHRAHAVSPRRLPLGMEGEVPEIRRLKYCSTVLKIKV